MGEFCRRFWTPVLLSEELPEPDCAPVQTKIYGEELVAFRTTSGKVGVLKEFCPHRHASLFYGRNEEEGLRCAYHGWKFDVGWPVRRHDVGAGGQQLRRQGPRRRLPHPRGRRVCVGLHGTAGSWSPPCRSWSTSR